MALPSTGQVVDRTADPAWRAAFARTRALLALKPATGFRLGRVTEDDKRGPSRW